MSDRPAPWKRRYRLSNASPSKNARIASSSSGRGVRSRRADPSRRMTSRTITPKAQPGGPPSAARGVAGSLFPGALALLDLALALGHHVRVAQRGRVAELAALGAVPQR